MDGIDLLMTCPSFGVDTNVSRPLEVGSALVLVLNERVGQILDGYLLDVAVSQGDTPANFLLTTDVEAELDDGVRSGSVDVREELEL